MTKVVYLNGEIVPEDKACVSVFDRGFLYGDGIFETIRVYGGVPFRWDQHMERMAKSASTLGINWSNDNKSLRDAASELLSRNKLTDAYMRITLSRGKHSGNLGFDTDSESTLLMVVAEPRLPSDENYGRGVAAVIIPHTWISPMAAHKTLSYLPYLAAMDKAQREGAREALLCGPTGRLAEGATSNVFIVFGERIFTPPADGRILPGIARDVVIESLPEAGAQCIEEHIPAEDARTADEIFITNSTVEVLPVTKLDGANVGNGKVGPATRKAMKSYRSEVKKKIKNHG